MLTTICIAGFAVLCIAPAVLDGREDRRVDRDFRREQQSRTEATIAIGQHLRVERPEEAKGLYKLLEN